MGAEKSRFFGCWPQNDDLRQIVLSKNRHLPYVAEIDKSERAW